MLLDVSVAHIKTRLLPRCNATTMSQWQDPYAPSTSAPLPPQAPMLSMFGADGILELEFHHFLEGASESDRALHKYSNELAAWMLADRAIEHMRERGEREAGFMLAPFHAEFAPVLFCALHRAGVTALIREQRSNAPWTVPGVGCWSMRVCVRPARGELPDPGEVAAARP